MISTSCVPGQVDFPTVEPWRVDEDTQAKIPLVLSGFESSAQVSVLIAVKFGRLWVSSSDEDENGESLVELGESLTLAGTQDEINLALENVWFSGAMDWNSLGQRSFETLSVLVDEQEPAQGGDPYPGVPRTLVINVVAANDPPVLRGPAEFNTVESTSSIVGGIEVSDVDDQDAVGSIMEVTVSIAEEGSFVELGSKLGLNILESADQIKTFQGSITNINSALAGLTFRGPFEFSGVVELKVEVDDMGNTGEGGSMSASLLVPIYVSSVNNPPRVVSDDGLLLRSNEDDRVSVNGIVIEDQDAGDGRVRLTVEALYGVFSFEGDLGELEFERGDGILDDGATILGTIEVGVEPSEFLWDRRYFLLPTSKFSWAFGVCLAHILRGDIHTFFKRDPCEMSIFLASSVGRRCTAARPPYLVSF